MTIYDALGGVALAADPADLTVAARIRGAVAALRQRAGISRDPRDEKLERRLEQPLIQRLGDPFWEQDRASGATMTLEETIDLAYSLFYRGSTRETSVEP